MYVIIRARSATPVVSLAHITRKLPSNCTLEHISIRTQVLVGCGVPGKDVDLLIVGSQGRVYDPYRKIKSERYGYDLEARHEILEHAREES